jgi:hypothetical protein
MGEETARLREEIDRTRENLTRNVDLLAEKTSPSRIVERRVERTRRGLVGLKEKVMGSSDARHGASSATYGPTYTEDAYATGATNSGESRLESMKQSTTDAASQAAESARETLSSAREQVAATPARAQEAVSTVREQAEGNPLAAGLVAFGIGWLISSLMPASEAETSVAQRAGEVAKEHGGPVLEQAKQTAQDVGHEFQEHAQEAAQQVRERTQDATAFSSMALSPPPPRGDHAELG